MTADERLEAKKLGLNADAIEKLRKDKAEKQKRDDEENAYTNADRLERLDALRRR